MSKLRAPGERRRTRALWCAGIGLFGVGAPLLLVLLIMVNLQGASQMAAALPLMFLNVTWWIWLLLGLAGLALSRDADRPLLPVVLSVVTMLAAFGSFIVIAGEML